jgi:UDP-N-acetylmuramate--alanine ligase
MHREFETFFRNIPFYGLAVTCIDHPVARDMVERLELRRDGRRLLTYGTTRGADLVLRGLTQERGGIVIDAELGARVRGGERQIRGWAIPIPGQHNALNALAAIATATEAGIPDNAIRAALSTFTGVKRRFEQTGTWNGATFYDDYGHHPAEIAAVLAAARARSRGRVIAVFEPHRYSRVNDLFGDFCACFRDADSVIVGPLYSAGEAPIKGIDQHSIAEGIRATGHQSAMAVDAVRDLAPLLRHHVVPGDMVICLGAGTSTEWAHGLPQWLAADEPRRANA